MGGYVARMGERRGAYTVFCWVNLTKKYHLDYPGVDEWIILKWIFRKWNGRHGLD
jgi:hypothetical protein